MALHRASEGLPCKTAVHICYGYGIKANIDWKESLGAEWRQYEAIFPNLAASRIHQVSVECAGAKVPLDLLRLLQDKEVLLGAIDVASDRVETPEEVAERSSGRRALFPHELRHGTDGPVGGDQQTRRTQRWGRDRPSPGPACIVAPGLAREDNQSTR